MKKKKQKTPAIVYCLIPIIGFFALFLLGPIVGAFWISLTGMWRNPGFVGLANYKRLISDPVFGTALMNTFYFTGVAVPLNIGFALIIALFIQYLPKGKSFFRTAYFLPVVTSMVGAATVWRWLYQPMFGLINQVLALSGLTPQMWLISKAQAMPAVIIMSVWKKVGYNIVLFLAALATIPLMYHEAATIDGAGAWRRFKDITLPLLRPALLFITFMTMISALQIFTEVYVMTMEQTASGGGGIAGGPDYATNVLVLYIQQEGFGALRMGYAASMSFVLFIIIIIASVLLMRIMKSKWNY